MSELILREGTSDHRILREVVEKRCYRKKSIGFDVEADEVWLDLGANFGAFAHYVHSRGARAICYEAHPDNFEILQRNLNGTQSVGVHAAVTALRTPTVDLFESHLNDLSRPTVVQVGKFHKTRTVPNIHYDDLPKTPYGIKMDIEGAEGFILDNKPLFHCAKLVLEYHSSRDPFVYNFRERLYWLKSQFEIVSYPPEFDRILESGIERFEKTVVEKGRLRTVQYPVADRLIFCMKRRPK